MNVNTANLKIIFAGSVGAGKTTSILSVSDIDVINTEETATDEVRMIKATTTVALDYGQMILDDGTFLHLYGAPGQGRFDFMWDILANGALGVAEQGVTHLLGHCGAGKSTLLRSLGWWRQHQP